MLELCAVKYFDSATLNRHKEIIHDGTVRLGRGLKYEKERRWEGVCMSVRGDEPVDAFIFDGPEFILICRVDLLDGLAHQNGGIDSYIAAQLARLY